MIGNKLMGYTSSELEGPSNPLEMKLSQEVRVQRWREGIPNAIIERLNRGVPEAREFRFKPYLIGLLSYAPPLPR